MRIAHADIPKKNLTLLLLLVAFALNTANVRAQYGDFDKWQTERDLRNLKNEVQQLKIQETFRSADQSNLRSMQSHSDPFESLLIAKRKQADVRLVGAAIVLAGLTIAVGLCVGLVLRKPTTPGFQQHEARRTSFGVASIVFSIVSFLASFAYGGGGTVSGGIVSGCLDPLFFIGLPFGIYLLRSRAKSDETISQTMPIAANSQRIVVTPSRTPLKVRRTPRRHPIWHPKSSIAPSSTSPVSETSIDRLQPEVLEHCDQAEPTATQPNVESISTSCESSERPLVIAPTAHSESLDSEKVENGTTQPTDNVADRLPSPELNQESHGNSAPLSAPVPTSGANLQWAAVIGWIVAASLLIALVVVSFDSRRKGKPSSTKAPSTAVNYPPVESTTIAFTNSGFIPPTISAEPTQSSPPTPIPPISPQLVVSNRSVPTVAPPSGLDRVPAQERSLRSLGNLPQFNTAAEYREFGVTQFEVKNYGSAIEAFSAGISRASSSEQLLGQLQGDRAAAYLELGEYRKAIDACTTLINSMPRNASAYRCRANAYQRLGKSREAKLNRDIERELLKENLERKRLPSLLDRE